MTHHKSDSGIDRRQGVDFIRARGRAGFPSKNRRLIEFVDNNLRKPEHMNIKLEPKDTIEVPQKSITGQ